MSLTLFDGRGRYGLVLLELLLLLPLAVLGQTPYIGQCTPKEQRKALSSIYAASDGPNWLSQDLWNTNETCFKVPEPRQANVAGQPSLLPSFCCWDGVDCCLSETYNKNLTQCAQYQCNCSVGTVTGLSLGRNNMKGNLQDILRDEVMSGLACSLRMLFLGGNGLQGYVPPGIGQLRDLRILSLSSNALTGSIPIQLTALAELEELDLSNNNLNGTVPSLLCGGVGRPSHLRDLVLSNNNLTGPLDIPGCEELINLDVQNNWLEGPMLDISTYRQLHILRLGNNIFSGAVNVDAFDLRLLVLLDLSLNWFTGPLPNFVGNSSQLALVRLYNNNFSGPIPSDLFSVGTLSNFIAYNNKLTGTLPENIGDARGISSLNLRGNDLHGTLPPSLEQLAPNLGTVDLSLTRMSCCGFDFVEGQGYRHFNMNAPRLPAFLVPSDLNRPVVDTGISLANMRCPFIVVRSSLTGGEFLTWALDPEYYLYSGCTCLAGFNEVWTNPTDGVPSMGPLLTCVAIVDPWYIQYPWAVVLIVLGGLLVALWLTYAMCFRSGKNAAIVQGCFNIRKRIQGEPVGGQVSIVVTDIEGYSDLMKQSPALMTRALNLHNAIVRKSRWNNFGYTLEQEGDSYALVFYEAHDAVIFCLQTQLALNRQTWPEGLFTADPREPVCRRRPQAPSLLNAISAMTNNLTHSLFGGRTGPHGLDELRTEHTSLDGRPDSRQSSTAAGAPVPAAPTGPDMSTLVPPAAAGGAHKAHPVLFNGLRVRMGIATGTLPPGNGSKGSAVMDMAKVVSDSANGGQTMICETTFMCVKERIEEFGAVDHNGMNFKQLNSIKPPWYSCLKRKHLRNQDDALLLDMGEYTHCPGASRLPLFQLEGSTATAETLAEGAWGGGQMTPATPRAPGRRGKGYEPMRLYQLLPPPLVGRAKAFGNKVTVKEEWYASDAPYFDAPGTLDAPLGAVEGPMQLPPITMAFAIVDGGKPFASRHRRDVRRVHDVCAACIRACLRLVAGGYLCRMQDGDLKYMVAFATPEAAVEWALLLQDVLMYADWPEAALKYWREEYDDRGRLVFRGPRMKIGLCEGAPRSIIPDHIGRADYHGASVNQAARYMDAAAHGGMVAIEAALAAKVMNTWRTAATVKAAAAAGASAATAGAAAPSGDRASSSSASASAFAAAGAASATVAAGASASVVSASNASGTGGGGVKASRLSSGTSAAGAGGGAGAAAAAAVSPLKPPPPTRVASWKARMAAVQEADGADTPDELPPPAAAAATVTAPPPLAAVLPDPPVPLESSKGTGPRPAGGSGGSEQQGTRSALSGEPAAAAAGGGPAAAAAAGGGGGGGPVAEAEEGDGADAAADPAAVAVNMAAAAVGNGNGSFPTAAGEVAAAAAGLSAEAEYDTGVGGRRLAESGPSMTSVASGSYGGAGMGTSSSTTTATAPLLPFGSSTSEADALALTTTSPPPPPPPATAGSGLSHHQPSAKQTCNGSTSYGENTAAAAVAAVVQHGEVELTAAASAAGGAAARVGAPGAPQWPVDSQPSGSAPRPPPPAAAAATLGSPAIGPRPHVSFASHPIVLADSGNPSPAGPPPQRASSAAASAAASFASAAVPLSSPAPSTLRSPRPPALTPLSLPSECERDESLRVGRAAAEAAKKVSVDGPAEASYEATVAAFRIGVFCFKGNPEPIQMAHVILGHLSGRRFPTDTPKGKGAKVGDSSGLVDECTTRLPDLAALLRDRYLLINGAAPPGGRQHGAPPGLSLALSPTPDVTRSSPSNRRLRALLAANSPTGPNAGGGSSSPRGAGGGGRFLGNSGSSAAGRNSSGCGGGGASPTGASGGGNSGVGPAATSDGGGGGQRRGGGGGLVTQLSHLMTVSKRWAAGKGAAAPVASSGQRSGGGGGGGTDRQLELLPPPGMTGDGACGGGGGAVASVATAAAAPAEEGAVKMAVAVSMAAGPAAGGQSGQGGGAVEGESGAGPVVVAVDGGAGGGGSSDPRVARPSPLRHVSGRDDLLPNRESGAAGTHHGLSAGASSGPDASAGESRDTPRGDEHV